jgi:hypothetical protein
MLFDAAEVAAEATTSGRCIKCLARSILIEGNVQGSV